MKARPSSTTSRKASGTTTRVRGRPPVISNDDLLKVARQVFLEHGIRATTAEVAARAGIAEGTVFLRFKSKDALFRAAMCIDPKKLPPFVEGLADRAGKGELREILVEFATRMLEVGKVALPLIVMSWSNPTGEFALENAAERSHGYRGVFRAIRRFFELEMRLGRLGASDSELLTRIFMGSLHHYCLSEFLLAGEQEKRLSPAAFAEGLVDLLLRAAPAGTGATANGRRTRARPRASAG